MKPQGGFTHEDKVMVIAIIAAMVGAIEQLILGQVADAFIQPLVVEPIDQMLSNPTPGTRGLEDVLRGGTKLVLTSYLPWWAAGTVTVLAAIKKMAPRLLD